MIKFHFFTLILCSVLSVMKSKSVGGAYSAPPDPLAEDCWPLPSSHPPSYNPGSAPGYDIHEEAYRRRFRTVKREEGESNRELAVRLMDLQGKWLCERTTMGQVKEAIGIEQFLNTLTNRKATMGY